MIGIFKGKTEHVHLLNSFNYGDSLLLMDQLKAHMF